MRNCRVPDANEEAPAAVADAIKCYLDAHPNAADSVEGIAHWWLTRQRFEDATEVVEEALERLVAKGEITNDGCLIGKEIRYGKCSCRRESSHFRRRSLLQREH